MEQQSIDFYPITPGFEDRGTGRDAARGVRGSDKRAQTLNAIIGILRRDGPATADEIAERLGMDRLYIRPRMSELRAIGRIVHTGERRRNPGGRPATVWGTTERG